MDTRLSFLLQHSNDIFCVFDLAGNIIKTNASFWHFTGYNEQELSGKNIIDLSCPDHKNKTIALFNTISSKKNIAKYLTRITAKNGELLSILWSLSFNEDDQLIYATGIYTHGNLNIWNHLNISDKLQHVLANLTEGFFMLDKDWRINAFNPAFHAIIYLPVNELYFAHFRLIYNLII